MSLVMAYTLDKSNDIVTRAECETEEGAKIAVEALIFSLPEAVSGTVIRYKTDQPSDEVAHAWHTDMFGGWVRDC